MREEARIAFTVDTRRARRILNDELYDDRRQPLLIERYFRSVSALVVRYLDDRKTRENKWRVFGSFLPKPRRCAVASFRGWKDQ